MADHGVNRRRSFFARGRHRRGVAKALANEKRRDALLRYWRHFWSKPIEKPDEICHVPQSSIDALKKMGLNE